MKYFKEKGRDTHVFGRNNRKPYVYSASDHFTLVLPDLTYVKGVESEDLAAIVFFPVQNGTEHDEKVLSFCYHKAHKASEIARILGITDSSYFRKQVLDNLVKNDYLIKSKVSRASFYKTNTDIVNLE